MYSKLGRIASRKPSHDYLKRAAGVQSRVTQSPGARYARALRDGAASMIKNEQRSMLLSHFKRSRFKSGLSILTLPGLNWSFEKWLLQMREGGRKGGPCRQRPRRTHITSVERDSNIYRLSFKCMPGLVEGVRYYDPPEWSDECWGTPVIPRFHRGKAEAAVEWYARDDTPDLHAAWLDLTGPATARMMDALQALWDRDAFRVLVLTSMSARWSGETRERVLAAGGYVPWLKSCVPAPVNRSFSYKLNRSPMVQYSWAK